MSKKLKAIKIDVNKKLIYEVELDGTLFDYYKQLQCSLIDKVCLTDTHDLILDDEARIVRNEDAPGGFCIDGRHAFIGHGLIVRHDDEGGWVSHRLNVEQVAKLVAFIDREQVDEILN